ncbi:M20/M25/M40 family metallo-hydrolase [Solimonas marina]|uniref:M20/M25/M40 family metallo-hydrolase n=1 Tax=Solimonas marina TaxID=2714601 RepID=A0A969W695_9GAMM|nr:M20/M25/M40 family metallo-hydrolase [Solimonas marina]NKF21347.1 M20/M25/M40 family metallo-hydrolase [Solimonas marina]
MMRKMQTMAVALGSALLCATAGAGAKSDGEAAFRALYKELIETNTTLSVGSCRAAEDKMAARLRAAGYGDADLHFYAPEDRPKDAALIATLPGSDGSLKPILLLAHIDVVEAKREDWQRDPFTLVEENGYFYARGASDDKAMASVFTDSMIRYKQEGFEPRRGLKLALTCGEETPEHFNSVYWLIQHHPQVLDAAFALNEGAGGELDAHGQPRALQLQAGEKVYQDYTLETTNPGGHSSRPVPDNAIYELSTALLKVGAHQFPMALNDATRAYFTEQAKLAAPDVAADMKAVLEHQDETAAQRLWKRNPGWYSMMRTTCVATMVDAGHAPNALPQRATANVNCRILPGVPPEQIEQALAAAIADPGVKITAGHEPSTGVGAPPPLNDKILGPVRQVAEQIWPGVAIVPTMSTGATDSRFLNGVGIPSYGMSGMFFDAEGSHAHGLDERIRVKSLMDGRRFLYNVVKLYANQT